jgi:hypothetical protein
MLLEELVAEVVAAVVAAVIAVAVTVTVAAEENVVVVEVALSICARTASVPFLNACPVLPRVKLAEQQLPLEEAQQ